MFELLKRFRRERAEIQEQIDRHDHYQRLL